MATRRSAPPKKQPSPPKPPAESSEDEEEELESDSGKESEEERDGKQSQSKALDDDDEDDSDEGDDSGEEDSESEPEQPTPSRPQSATAASTVPTAASDDDDDDDDDERSESGEADSETEEEQPVPDPPVPRAAITGKPSNKNSVPEPRKDAATPPKTTTGEAAKKLFHRIWSDEDQITLLKGMVDYIDTEGKDPIANIEGFWLFIRKKLSFTVTEWQLMSKIRAVKAKYRSNQEKDRAFNRAYDAEVFELSKKVWGAGEKSMAMENGGGKKRKSDKLVKEAEAVKNGANDEVVDRVAWEDETVNLSKEHFGWSEDLARVKIKSVAESERKLLVLRWKKLKAEEVRGFLNRRSLEVDSLKIIF